MKNFTKFQPQSTGDGSFTFFSSEFQETFHSHYGAREEAMAKFVLPCRLPEKAKHQETISILDVCYGLGYNTAAALGAIWQVNPHCRVRVMALEQDPLVAPSAIAHQLLQSWPSPIPEHLAKLAFQSQVKTPHFTGQLWLGDARHTVQNILDQNFQADAIFLDPFSPPKCPQLWTVEFLQKLAHCLHPEGLLSTYSCAAAIRKALQIAGLHLGRTPIVGRSVPGTVASFSPQFLTPLTPRSKEHLQTRAAIPYRDPTLQANHSTILENRRQEQQHSPLESTSQWKKRWEKGEKVRKKNNRELEM